ncbi:hypothetical protein ABT144_10950 [Streptomyces sp. NPDC002039]|uniref:effector-associated constant component EACC1 n=1 Tax=Streptomyces sp. NPDC002039 TaxID=3154660 RepID=UPI00332DE1FC
MRLLIMIDEELDGAAASLYRELKEAEDLPDDAKLALVPAKGQPGDMGAELIIELVSAAAGIASFVVQGVTTWRGRRRRAPGVRIEGDGVTVVIDDRNADPDHIADLAARLRRAEPDPDGGGQEPA